jgi:hypothetical protein
MFVLGFGFDSFSSVSHPWWLFASATGEVFLVLCSKSVWSTCGFCLQAACVSCGWLMQFASDQVEAAQQAGLSPEELRSIRVFQASTPSVVNVTNVRAMQSFYTMDVEKIPAGTGSGFIWDKKGESCAEELLLLSKRLDCNAVRGFTILYQCTIPTMHPSSYTHMA